MKAILSSLSDIPEALRGEYEQKDGKYVLKLEGDYPGFVKADDLGEANRKLAEFRDNNISLQKKLAAYDGVDVEEHKKLKEKAAEFEKHGVKGGNDLQKAIENAVTPLQKKLEEITERESRANAQLARKEIETVLTQEGLKAGIREEAITDYLRRGIEVWKLEEGKPVAKDGDMPLFSKRKPSEPLSPTEWVALLSIDAPHLFRPSKGGGANPGQGGNGERMTYNRHDDSDFLKNVAKIAKGEMIPTETS